MAGIEVDASELNALVVDLGLAGARAGAAVSVVVRKTALRVEAEAKAFAPVDTGNLRNSISGEITSDGRSDAVEAVVGPTASYGAFVEFGTSRHGPQAFMGPAFDRAQPDFLAALAQIVGDAL